MTPSDAADAKNSIPMTPNRAFEGKEDSLSSPETDKLFTDPIPKPKER